ncbi:hypothetical protein BESB_040080 [Besnoitia besnoiti]|uniref:Apicomplexan specific, related protein n=1 Tax=Besnoitia besnoiti TaxID=94643 RepID=A0A2A9MP46_BESBE|nr:hypothetical protein BESB_040080 [Besnoitia besnoiti]PFH37550.1 hypothetical protein BESB_040080 [Besnoitia besnoiti]
MATTACRAAHPSASRLPHCLSCECCPGRGPARVGDSTAVEDRDREAEADDCVPSIWATLLAAEEEEWEGGDDPVAQLKRGKAFTGRAKGLLCPSQRCRTWLDLKIWFGLEDRDLSKPEFDAAFIPVRKDGIGLFEHFVEIGTKTLETIAEMFFFHHYSVYEAQGWTQASTFPAVNREKSEIVAPVPPPIPPDLAFHVPAHVPQLLYTQKHAERACSPTSLYRFGVAYLAGAQGLTTRTSVVEYVRACIGYACCCSDHCSKSLYVWGPNLVEHIYWTQRVLSGSTREESALLHDLYEYFGYTGPTLSRKILRALGGTEDATITAAPPGERVLRVYLQEYFEQLARDSGVPCENQMSWAARELEHFLESPALALFASVVLSLAPYVADGNKDGVLQETSDVPPSTSYVSTFLTLLSLCWRGEQEERARVWMNALVKRLRQLQLIADVVRQDEQNQKDRRRRTHAFDLRRMDYVKDGLLGKYLIWSKAFEEAEANRQAARIAAEADGRRLKPTPEALALFARAPASCGGSPGCALLERALAAFEGRRVSGAPGDAAPAARIGAFPHSYGMPDARGVWAIRDKSGKLHYEMLLVGAAPLPTVASRKAQLGGTDVGEAGGGGGAKLRQWRRGRRGATGSS